MKITKIQHFFPAPRIRLLKLETDSGLVGWGESTLEGKPQSVFSVLDECAEYLIGKDPLCIEHHWQQIYRSAFFRGGPHNMTALSAIDHALWDIAGKHYGVPCYRLMGGPVRQRIRVYTHIAMPLAGVPESPAQESARAVLQAQGYTAYKTPLLGKWRAQEPPSKIDEFVNAAFALRERLGPDVEIGFDFHGKLTPALAVQVCLALAPIRPMFVEEPVQPENPDALKFVSDHVPFPIATGERLLSRWEYRRVIEQQAAAILQPDVAHCGGLSELRKIANMAEIYSQHMAPHCAIGPVALAASLQVNAVVPNFLVQEHVRWSLGEGILKEPLVVQEGYIALSDKPGLGIEIDEDRLAAAYRGPEAGYHAELGAEYYDDADGSVVDW